MLNFDVVSAGIQENKLQLNDDKYELLIVSSKNAQNKIQNKSIQIGSSTISASTNAWNLGSYLDSTLSMENHKKVCQAAYFKKFGTNEALENFFPRIQRKYSCTHL